MSKTLYCAISSHGFGHIAQSAPILNRLHRLRPDIKIIIQCESLKTLLDELFDFPFVHMSHSSDFGMIMKSALEIDAQASHQAYLQVHDHWQESVQAQAKIIKRYQPDLIYCNIAYLVNAAATTLNIPVVNLCSLNWYHIYRAYCGELSGATKIMQVMVQAYNEAQIFLAPEPSMSMPEIVNLKHIGPVARIGKQRAEEIRHQYHLSAASRLVLVSYGGVEYRVDFNRWPQTQDIYYLVSEKQCIERDDFIHYESLLMPYIDILSSCDVIITKSGYGTYAEAACHGIPLMYTRRPDWPEDIYLVEWLEKMANCIELTSEDLQNGNVVEPMQKLLGQKQRPAVEPDGIMQAVDALLHYLSD